MRTLMHCVIKNMAGFTGWLTRMHPIIDLFQLNPEDQDGLIAALQSDNMLWRMQAQRLLVERGELDVLPELFALIENKTLDEIGLASPAVHALWTLHGLNTLEGTHQKALQVVENALLHPAPGVRKAAIQVLPKGEDSFDQLFAAKSFDDPDPHTRLAAVLAIGDMPASDAIGSKLFELSQDQSINEDPWLAQAAYVISARYSNSFIKAVTQADPSLLDQAEEIEEQDMDWLSSSLDVSNWQKTKMPARWDDTGAEDLYVFDGVVWLYHTFELTTTQASQKAILSLGAIDDSDQTYMNGKLVGATEQAWDEKTLL